MKFIINTNREIPGYGGIRGPILTPQEIPIDEVLKMVSSGFDIRELMEDGSYRKVEFSDQRLIDYKLRRTKEEVVSNVVTEETLDVKEKSQLLTVINEPLKITEKVDIKTEEVDKKDNNSNKFKKQFKPDKVEKINDK